MGDLDDQLTGRCLCHSEIMNDGAVAGKGGNVVETSSIEHVNTTVATADFHRYRLID